MIHCLGGLCVPGGLFCFRFYQPLFTPLLVTQWVVGGGGFCGVCLCRSIFVFRIFAFLFCDAYFFFLVFCLFLLCWWFCFIPDDCVGRCVDGAYNVMCILCCSLPGGVVCRRTKTVSCVCVFVCVCVCVCVCVFAPHWWSGVCRRTKTASFRLTSLPCCWPRLILQVNKSGASG